MKKPWLSVLIPTYNGEEYLASSLESITIQDDPDIECIVVDDASTDSTISILKSYQDRLPIKLFQRERIGNWVTNTNYALFHASADYVCFLHQDDLWLEDRLKIMKSIIEQYPDVNLFLHASQFIDRKESYLGLWQCPLPKNSLIVDPNMMIERLLIQNFISIPAPIFKREVALSVGGLDENLWYTADWDFWLKIAAVGKTMYYPQALAAFRVHPSSQTVLRSSSIKDFKGQLRIVVQKYLDNWKIPEIEKKSIRKVALFSVNLNTNLAAKIHGKKINLFNLCFSFLVLGPLGWHRYLRDSRIWERVYARIKARINS